MKTWCLSKIMKNFHSIRILRTKAQFLCRIKFFLHCDNITIQTIQLFKLRTSGNYNPAIDYAVSQNYSNLLEMDVI